MGSAVGRELPPKAQLELVNDVKAQLTRIEEGILSIRSQRRQSVRTNFASPLAPPANGEELPFTPAPPQAPPTTEPVKRHIGFADPPSLSAVLNISASKHTTFAEDVPLSTPSAKKRDPKVQQKRNEFFGPLVFEGEWHELQRSPDVKCVFLNCVALGASFVSGTTVKLEDIFVGNTLASHYAAMTSVTLPELYDIALEFVQAKLPNFRVDICPIEAPIDPNDCDDNPIVSLLDFRKEVSASLNRGDEVIILNYDPYVVEDAEVKASLSPEDEDDEFGARVPMQWAKKNQGSFAILTDYNSALQSATIVVPHITPNGEYSLEEHLCSLQTLYNALCAKDGYSKRPRGFIRITSNRKDSKPLVQSLYPIRLLDGSESRGQLSIALDISISTSLLALGIAQHLVTSCFNLTEGSGFFDGLRGIAVTDVCSALQLPEQILVASTTRSSVEQAFSWYVHYLEKKRLRGVWCSYTPITRKDNAEDGALSMEDSELVKLIVQCMEHKAVVIVGFDASKALNVELSQGDNSHFAIVAGFDETTGTVLMADVCVKKLKKMWQCPIQRLYNAIIGYGIIIISNSKEFAQEVGVYSTAKPSFSSTLFRTSPRFALPPKLRREIFQYPRRPYNVTMIARALTELGFSTTVEDLLYNSGFHISFLLSDHIPLADLARISTYYSRVKLGSAVTPKAHHFDKGRTLEEFESIVRQSVASGSKLVFNFSSASLQSKPELWNGGLGGNCALLEDYDSQNHKLTVSDASHEAYTRVWTISLQAMFDLCSEMDRIANRARGVLEFSKQPLTVWDDSRKLDLRFTGTQHPFKPPAAAQISVLALCVSDLYKVVSPEEILYRNPDFSLVTIKQDFDVARTLQYGKHMSEFTQQLIRFEATEVPDSAAEFAKLADTVTKDKQSLMVLVYHVPAIFPAAPQKFGGSVVDRVRDGKIMCIDGNPTGLAERWEVAAETLLDAIQAAGCGIIVARK